MGERVRVAFVGVGRTGMPAFDQFMKHDYVDVVGVADLSEDAPGMVKARQAGIFTTTDPFDLVKMDEGVDILIDATGDPEFKRHAKDYYGETGNKKTIIMHDLIVRLITSLCTDSGELMESVHPTDVGIG